MAVVATGSKATRLDRPYSRTRARWLTLIAVLLLGPTVCASELRHEVGIRLHSFERTWNEASADAKKQALPFVERAVRSFFGFDLTAVGEGLDQARLRLMGQAGPARWFDSVSVQPVSRVALVGTPLSLKVTRFYATSDPWPSTAMVWVRAQGDGPAPEPHRLALEAAPESQRVTLPFVLAAGDWVLRVAVYDGETLCREWTDVVSLQDDPTGRIAALELRLDVVSKAEIPGDAPPAVRTRVATARALLQRDRQLLEGAVPELPFAFGADLRRAAELIGELESVSGASDDPESTGPSESRLHLGVDDQWWVIAHGGKRAPVRAWIPERLSEPPPPPLVLAVHGLGGTENLFFESYGAGRVVELCRERGWILVAPRQPLFGGMPLDDLVRALTPLISFDPARVFIVGHSKGAAESLDAIQRAPKIFRAGALLGGGGRVRSDAALTDFPIYVAAGERDFGRGMAERAHEALLAAGAASQWAVIAHTEHLTVVADALPAVFRFFDHHAGAARPPEDQ